MSIAVQNILDRSIPARAEGSHQECVARMTGSIPALECDTERRGRQHVGLSCGGIAPSVENPTMGHAEESVPLDDRSIPARAEESV